MEVAVSSFIVAWDTGVRAIDHFVRFRFAAHLLASDAYPPAQSGARELFRPGAIRAWARALWRALWRRRHAAMVTQRSTLSRLVAIS